jgi:hypothetical protein
MDIFTLLIWLFLLAGALLLLFRTFWGQPPARPDLLAGGLLCWLIATILERLG